MIKSTDLLVAFAMLMPFVVVALLLWNDIVRWLSGQEIGAGESPEVRGTPSGGLSATLTEPAAASLVAGADDYSHLDRLIDEVTA